MSDRSSFGEAVLAIIDGDEAKLRALLRAHPALVHERAEERHRATLLHFVGANGVEPQRSPKNAVRIARILLDAGADPDATAPVYGQADTTMGLLVSSVHPWKAGVQAPLVDLLLDYGAKSNDLGVALMFGYTRAAERLALRGARSRQHRVRRGVGADRAGAAHAGDGDRARQLAATDRRPRRAVLVPATARRGRARAGVDRRGDARPPRGRADAAGRGCERRRDTVLPADAAALRGAPWLPRGVLRAARARGGPDHRRHPPKRDSRRLGALGRPARARRRARTNAALPGAGVDDRP